MVFSVGLAAVSFASGGHASAAVKTGATAHANMPNAAKLTALLHPSGGHASPVKTTSGNWAGYANVLASTAYGTIYEATGEWFTPTVTCTNAPSGGAYQVSWIGIDGFGTGTVEQAGTLSYCSTTGATPAYWVWWEFYPYNSIQFVTTISAGDLVQAYILYNPAACVNSVCGVYTLQLTDLSSGTAFMVYGGGWICAAGGSPCEGGPDGSAECISEAPSGFGYSGVTPVSKYGTTTFFACADTIGSHFAGIGSQGTRATDYRINQIGGVTGLTDQSTGPLITYFYGLSEFVVTWHHYD